MEKKMQGFKYAKAAKNLFASKDICYRVQNILKLPELLLAENLH